MKTGRVVAVGAIGVGLVLLLGACKAKVGGSCLTGQSDCQDKTNGLTCGTSGKYELMPCRGANGCTKQGAKFDCDDSVAMPDDRCDEENEVACQVDKKAALECHSGKFVVGETCKGPHGCEIKGDKITCDNDISDVGDPCHFNGDYACTSDKTLVLRCLDNKMQKLNSCRGAHSCSVKELPAEHKVEFICDDSVALVNDPCDEDGEYACAVDRKSILRCKGAQFLHEHDCTGPKGCTFDDKGERFDCDTTGGHGSPVDVKQPVPPGTAQKPGGKKK
ncbi:MAG TPA: hypothetical protein VIF62_32455 [Labilithrix sp.]